MAIQAKHTGVLSAVGYAVTMNVDGLAGIGLQLTGVWEGTVQFNGSVDGVEFQALTVTPTNSTTGVTSATSNGIWQVSAALKHVQVLCSAYTSGYIVVTILAGESSVGGSGGGGGGGGGDATAANQVLEISALNSINTKTPALGQALAAGSVPVVLTAAQITTLTPLSSVTVTQATGTNLHAVVDSGTLTAVTAITNALPAGSNVIGHVITDTGSTTAVTGTVTVTGGLTDTQLRASAVPVTAVLTAGSAVIGHVINDASSAVIGHVIADSGSTTAVTQATATNLNAAVVGTGTAGTAAGGVLTVQGVTSMTKLLVTPDSVALPANQSVNMAQVGGTNTVTAGVAGTQAVGGNVANGVTATTNPVPVGGVFTTSPTTLSTGQTATLQFTAAQNIKNDVTTIAGTAADTNSGVKSAGTLRVVLATDQPALTNKLLVTPDANSAINLAQVNGTTTVNGGSAAGILAVGGPNATNVAITGNPVNNGAQAVSSENAAVTTARQVQLVADLVGKLIVLPYANPENFVSGAITSAMTGTTTTSLIAAPASGLRNYITTIVCSNAHATVGTDIVIQDGSGGTTLMTIPAAAVYGGAVISLPVPLRQPTTATAIFCANVTTGASTKVSAVGYKGA